MENLGDSSGSLDIEISSFQFSRPQISADNLLIDTSSISGGPVLRFVFAALKSEITQIGSRDLKHGKYLARGQCSQVVAAKWKGKDVAIKRLLERKVSYGGASDHQEVLSKVKQLQKDLEICTHPGLVQCGKVPTMLGYGMLDDLPFLVMEMADSGTLLHMLSADHEWSVRLNVLQQVALAVKVLHQNGMTHGDIKLENVLIFSRADNGFDARLSDFSHSTYDLDSSEPSGVYRYFGSWPITPPEVWTGSGQEVFGETCDIWAYSIILWRVCQYRNDDALKRLSFVPRHDDALGDTDMSSLLERLEAAELDFSTLLKTSESVDAEHREDIAAVFLRCFHLTTSKRCSASDLYDTLMTIAGKQPSSELNDAFSNLQLNTSEESAGLEVSRTDMSARLIDDGVETKEPQVPAWKAFVKDLPMTKMLEHKASWKIQEEFFAELAKRREARQGEGSVSQDVLHIWCQAMGYGCKRNTGPYLEIIKDQVEDMSQEHEIMQSGYEPGEHKRYPEIPMLNLLNNTFREVLELRNAGRDEETAESVEVMEAIGNVLRAFPTYGHHSMVWSAVHFSFPYAATYLANGSDVNAMDPRSGSTPLHLIWCLEDGMTILVADILLRFGASLEQPSEEGFFSCPHNMVHMAGTPLAWAVQAGNLIAVQTLLKHRANPLNGDGARCTPLELSVSLFQPEIVYVILEYLQDIGKLERRDLEAGPIGRLIINGMLPTLAHEQDRIKLHGSDIATAASGTLEVILHFWTGNKDILLRYILTLSVSDGHIPAPTIMASYRVQVLFKAMLPLTPDTTSPEWSTWLNKLLFQIIRQWDNAGEEAVDLLSNLLREHPSVIDLDTKDTLGRTLLHHIAIHNTTPLIPVLLRHGADLEARDSSGHTPVGLTARMAAAESFDTFLDAGAQLTHYDETTGHTSVLHLAAQLETHKSLLPYILFESRHRAQLCTPELLEQREGATFGLPALAWCVICMHREAIQAMMTAGANCRAACWLGGWDIVLSVRELATLVRYKPDLLELGSTWQKEEAVDPKEQMAWSKAVLEMFYSGCKEMGYEEQGFVERFTTRTGVEMVMLRLVARKTRDGEGWKQKYVSIDVLGGWSPRYGCSRGEENGLEKGEVVVKFIMGMPLYGSPSLAVLLSDDGEV